jgi:hypothetical protein
MTDVVAGVFAFFAAYGIFILFICMLPAMCFSIACGRLAAIKGYTGYRVSGFFFGIFALIYVVGLPLAKDDCRQFARRSTRTSGKSLY